MEALALTSGEPPRRARPMSGRDAGGNEAQEPGVGQPGTGSARGYVRCDASADRLLRVMLLVITLRRLLCCCSGPVFGCSVRVCETGCK